MGLADVLNSEDRVEVKFSEFYNLVKGCTQRDLILNAVKTRVPHKYIEQMVTGKVVESKAVSE